MRRSPAITLAVALAAVLVLPAGDALASCLLDERPLDQQVAEAQVVFVGTVTGLEDQQRTALFAVEEIWKGPDVDRQVAVHGGPGDPNMATSVDRSWQMGQRYLVMPRVEEGRLHDDSCSPTRPWDEQAAQARPADAREPTSGTAGEAADAQGLSSAVWIAMALAGVALVGGVGYVLTGRRR